MNTLPQNITKHRILDEYVHNVDLAWKCLLPVLEQLLLGPCHEYWDQWTNYLLFTSGVCCIAPPSHRLVKL